MTNALDREIRKQLGTAVREARKVAEDGARKAMTELGVEDSRKPEGLSAEKSELRTRLRAHARSLGDPKQPNDAIKADRLVREIAYEHWHRALFARFLAENNLLIDPEHKIAVSFADLDRIAKEEGLDAMALAAEWAEPMLPQIFRKDDPVLALSLPPETKAGIAELVNGLPRAVFAADDSLGWVYQFWQADNKARINESEVKIGADELPAVTQLFTEDYMVLFLLENTLGAWWASKQLAANPKLAAEAQSEDELREKTSPLGYRWTYLRFVREPREGELVEAATGSWRPAAGGFEGWPKSAKDVTVLDPCMGSGHFLVFALPILVAFRRIEEGHDERAAIRAVLAENLFGLEIDPRCTQIAAFALALASWKRLGGPETLPKLNLACSGLAIGLGRAEFLRLAEKMADAEGWMGKTDLLGTERPPLGETAAATHRGELEAIYDLFEQAPYLGSLIDPRRALERKFGPLFTTGMSELGDLLERLLEQSEASAEAKEIAVVAQGLSRAAGQLSRGYTLVVTNVPFLTRTKQHQVLKDFLERAFPNSKSDLATAFIQKICGQLPQGSAVGVVSPHTWHFADAFSKMRKELIRDFTFSIAANLGPAAFDDMNWWASKTAITAIVVQKPQKDSHFLGIDLKEHRDFDEKPELLISSIVSLSKQSDQALNPDQRIMIGEVISGRLLAEFAVASQGISPADAPHYSRFFWEIENLSEWCPWQGTILSTQPFSGKEQILWNNDDFRAAVRSGSAYIRGEAAWNKPGVVISQMGQLPAALFSGEWFDTNCAIVTPKNEVDLLPIWAYCSSPQYRTDVRRIDQALKVTNSSLTKVPFDLAHWQNIAAEKYPNGLPKPYSNDPTQWLFDSHPRGSADPSAATSGNPRLVTSHGIRPGMAEYPLQVAVARLLGYRWPRQAGSSFMDCPAITEPDEIDRSGLIDADGIVSLPALAGEPDAGSRLRELIRAIWGPDFDEGTLRVLLAAEGATALDLNTWLADEFFEGQCRLFHQTPFIWHVWDGLPGGFSALVNYHKLCAPHGAGRRLLEKLRDTHLGEWIAVQKRAQRASEPGAEQRLIAAEHLRDELTKIVGGEPPYDIFVRWKPLHDQPIGWEPDVDDGVRLNVRPFLTAKPRNPRGKDACILRVTPRVKKHAGADRGAEPQRDKGPYPWFWADDSDVAIENFAGGPEFKGRRYNDFHYSRSFKEAMRTAKAIKL